MTLVRLLVSCDACFDTVVPSKSAISEQAVGRRGVRGVTEDNSDSFI